MPNKAVHVFAYVWFYMFWFSPTRLLSGQPMLAHKLSFGIGLGYFYFALFQEHLVQYVLRSPIIITQYTPSNKWGPRTHLCFPPWIASGIAKKEASLRHVNFCRIGVHTLQKWKTAMDRCKELLMAIQVQIFWCLAYLMSCQIELLLTLDSRISNPCKYDSETHLSSLGMQHSWLPRGFIAFHCGWKLRFVVHGNMLCGEFKYMVARQEQPPKGKKRRAKNQLIVVFCWLKGNMAKLVC